MAKRRRPTKSKAPITLHVDVGSSSDDTSDADSSISEMFRELMSKHRSCWKHGFASFISQRERITLTDLKELHKMSPCLLTFPRRKRSNRKGRKEEMKELRPHKCVKHVVSSSKEKLDSGAFTCYFENIWKSFSEDKRTSFTYLDCLLFNLYLNPNFKDKVLRGIKKEHIFSKKYVIIPIICWSHWNLLIFCHFGESVQSETQKPCMLLLDSLENADPRRYEPDIRRFVLDIFREEGRPEQNNVIPLLVPKVPQQRNDVECGNFVLYFTKLFMEGAPKHFSLESYPYFMKKDWFSPESLDIFCQKLCSPTK